MHKISTLFLLIILLFSGGILNAQTDISAEAKLLWQTYLAESDHDEKTRDFIELRMKSFIANLEHLHTQVDRTASQLELSETQNKIGRDYQMLEATIRNLQQLSNSKDIDRTNDLQLLADLGIIYGQSRSLSRQK